MVWVYKNAGFHADVNNFNMEKSCEKFRVRSYKEEKLCVGLPFFVKKSKNGNIF